MQCPMSNQDTDAPLDAAGYYRCRCGRLVRLVKPKPGELSTVLGRKMSPRIAAHNVSPRRDKK